MKKSIKPLVLSLLLGLGLNPVSPAQAQTNEEPPLDCSKVITQMDATACAGEAFDAEDKALNEFWPKIKQAMAQRDREAASSSPDLMGYSAALLASQRAWLAYRDTQCELVGFEARGGTLEPMLIMECKADLTRERIKALKRALEFH